MPSADTGMLHLPVLAFTDAQSGRCLAKKTLKEFDFSFLSSYGSMTPGYFLKGCSTISKLFRRSLTAIHADLM
jgi:hypothetical protein